MVRQTTRRSAYNVKLRGLTQLCRRIGYRLGFKAHGCVILNPMDHIEALRQKIASLRSEIAVIQALNEQYRFGVQRGREAQIAHGQRLERLQEIQEELVQVSNLGRKTLSIEQMRERHRSRLHLVKQAS